MFESVNTDMNKKRIKKISEKDISNEYSLLSSTSAFLTSLIKRKNAELEYILKTLETNFTDELQERAERTHAEIVNLDKKIKWEVKKCAEFDNKVKNWQAQQKNLFVTSLSKKILNGNKNKESDTNTEI
jgi:hypothetical protein